MKHVVFLLAIYLTATLQAATGRELLPLLTVAAVFLFDGGSAIVWAALAGLAADGLSTGDLGVDMTVATLAAYLLQRLLGPERPRSAAIVVLFLLLGTFGSVLASSLVRPLLSGSWVAPGTLVRTAALNAASSSIVGLCVFLVCRTILRIAARHGTASAQASVNHWKMLTD